MLIHTYERTDRYCGIDDTWYTAAFKQLHNLDEDAKIRYWCYQTFGMPGYRPMTDEIRWDDQIKYGEVIFHHKDDLLMFVLKWS